MRASKINRDKQQEQGTEGKGCAVLDDEKRRQEVTVTILKQADDFAHANTKITA